jgi:hypothetical protein
MTPLFPFAQFEFTHEIGPPPGFYVVRDAGDAATDDTEMPDLASADVLVIGSTTGTAVESRFLRGRAKKVAAEEASREVALALATVIRGRQMLADETAAHAFVTRLRTADDERERFVDDALADVNRAIAAYRACAADPYVMEVARADARAVRVGYGTAEELRRATWSDAVTVPPPPRPQLDRGVKLMPVQGTAAVLAGQGEVLEGETLLLRVLLDLRYGRPRAAALGLDAAWALLQAELGERADAAAEAMEALDEIVRRARSGALGDPDVTALEDLAEQAGVLVDQWRYAPLGLA